MLNSSFQGNNYRKQLRTNNRLIEGLTNQSQSQTQDEISEATDELSRQMSNLARTQQQTFGETRDYLQVSARDSKYANQIVKTNDGTIGYITKRGIFKPFDSEDDVKATMGKNGCPANVQSIETKSGTYTEDGRYLNTETPVLVGTPMVRGQNCGYAGQNIFVNKPDKGTGNSQYAGCKKGDDMIATGVKMDVGNPPCPIGTFGCPNARGYCYDPKRDHMVSTYRIPNYDTPIGEVETGKSSPYLSDDGVTYLWFRQGGFDVNGCKMGKPTMPPCPGGTAPCPTKPGVCWEPSRKIMITTKAPNAKYVWENKPIYMALVVGDKFNYNEDDDPFVSKNRPNLPSNILQKWYADDQFKNPNYAPQNKIYFQFKAAAAQMMNYIDKNQSTRLTVVSEQSGSSNNAIFTVTKVNDTQAIGHLQNSSGSWSMQTNYNFIKPIRVADFGFLTQDGSTRFWKLSDGYDESCGTKPEVPPVLQVKKLFDTCKSIASNGGFNLFGIRDGECVVGNSVNKLERGSNCKKDNGIDIGEGGDIATYSLEGASNAGLYQYGYVTADEKLKMYPFENAKETRKFQPVGKQQIIRTPRSKTLSNISNPGECQAKCFSEYGNNCEAYGYNRQTKSCSIYGKDSLKEGKIMPGGKEDLMIRAQEFDNDISCPKNFNNVSSSVWGNLPMDGEMTDTTKCNLGYVTQDIQITQTAESNILNNNIDKMEDVIEQQFEKSRAAQLEAEKLNNQVMANLRSNLNEYDKLYNQRN